MKAVLFPGQGAQFKGMGKDLFPLYPEQAELAASVLGYSVESLCLEDPDNRLGLTEYTQPALFVINAMRWWSWRDRGFGDIDCLAGHSLGEYNALLVAGCFDFATGLRLVQKRGQLMAGVSGGGMAVLLGVSAEEVAVLLQDNDLVSIDLANFNSPTQTVVAGPADDVRRLESICDAKGVKCLVLKVSGPFHSRYMQATQRLFEQFIGELSLKAPLIPVISNVEARPYRHGAIAETLGAQIANPVQWERSIRYMMDEGVDEFAEMGPKLPGAKPTDLIRMVNDIRKAASMSPSELP